MIFNELLPKLEHHRTRLVYDSQLGRDTLFYHHILPYYSQKDLYMVIYSDTAYRRHKIKYEQLKDRHPDIAEILNRANIIKIGYRDSVSFGKLYYFIPEGNPEEEINALYSVLEELSDEDLVVFTGFFKLVTIGGKDILKQKERLVDSLPERITMFTFYQNNIYDTRTNRLINKLYDIIIRIKDEAEITFGEKTCLIGVEESIVWDVITCFQRYKIVNNMFVEV